MRKLAALLIIATLALTPVASFAKEKKDKPDLEAKAEAKKAEVKSRVDSFEGKVEKLRNDFAKEISERDKLMLQKRFVAGKEFYFMLEDYRDAAEIFWGIVLHPEARKFSKYNDAIYYLAESLFRMGYYYDSQQQYQRLVKVGPSGSYFTLALMRLIEISIAQKKYSAAQRYYQQLLSEAPAGTDSSLGTYLIGKSYFIRKDSVKAFEILESIPEGASHYAVAQYYMAALQVKNGQYDDATTRLKKLNSVFRNENIAHKESIEALTRLSLGRLSYEADDFPHAFSQYMAVPPQSEYYPEALYESIWVISTRNDFLLKATSDEDANYQKLVNDYAFLDQSMDIEKDKSSLGNVTSGLGEIEPQFSEMSAILDKIDKKLTTLQEEAVQSYQSLLNSAPGSPHLPEAEMLMGGIYTQVQDFDKAEAWYRNAQSKYSKFANQVNNAQTRFNNDRIAIEAVQAGNTPRDQPMPSTMHLGVPPEITFWLAADEEVKRIFEVYEGILKERESILAMRRLVRNIEKELRYLESGKGFPIMKQSKQRADALWAEAAQLEVEISTLKGLIANVEDGEKKSELQTGVPGFSNTVQEQKKTLKIIDRQIERKKREKIAAYKQDYRSLAAPITQYADQIESLYAEASDMTADVARQGLARVEQKLYDLVLQAQTGVVDTTWRATKGSGEEIEDIQRQMEEEIRKFRQQMRGAAPTDSGE